LPINSSRQVQRSYLAAGALAYRQAELTVQTLSEMIKDINDQNTRCSGLPLAARKAIKQPIRYAAGQQAIRPEPALVAAILNTTPF